MKRDFWSNFEAKTDQNQMFVAKKSVYGLPAANQTEVSALIICKPSNVLLTFCQNTSSLIYLENPDSNPEPDDVLVHNCWALTLN